MKTRIILALKQKYYPNSQAFPGNFHMLLRLLKTLIIKVSVSLLLIQPLYMLIEFIKLISKSCSFRLTLFDPEVGLQTFPNHNSLRTKPAQAS